MLRSATRIPKFLCLFMSFAIVGTIALASPATPSTSTLTVGDFLLMYARAVHVELPDGAEAGTALSVLQAAKLVPNETFALESPLTHKDILRVARAGGLKISSSTPDKEFSRPEAQLFLDTYSKLLASGGASGTTQLAASEGSSSSAPGHANLEKGKKKGRPFQSPTNP